MESNGPSQSPSVRLPGGIPSWDFPAAMLDDQRIHREFKISQCTPHLISNNFHVNPKKTYKHNPRKTYSH